ncbi:hypothetical protein D9M69_645510 [compost metagenome]
MALNWALEDETPTRADVYAVYPQQLNLSARVRSLIDFLIERFERIDHLDLDEHEAAHGQPGAGVAGCSPARAPGIVRAAPRPGILKNRLASRHSAIAPAASQGLNSAACNVAFGFTSSF